MRAATIGLVCLGLCTTGCGESSVGRRQAEVAEIGRAVMPFDLDRTTHVFEKLEDGGLQTVVSDDGDAEQVSLVRAHLREEAERFSRGDFHDPATIHGEDMPGLHALMMGRERLDVAYREIEGGADPVQEQRRVARGRDPSVVRRPAERSRRSRDASPLSASSHAHDRGRGSERHCPARDWRARARRPRPRRAS